MQKLLRPPNNTWWWRRRGLANIIYSDDPDVQIYVARMETPISAPYITKLDTLVASIKTALSITRLSERLSFYYVLANETAEAGKMNLVSPNFDLLEVGANTFTVDQGFAGNGSTGYFNTQYNFSGNEATQPTKNNSIAIGYYCRTALASENWVEWGCTDDGSKKFRYFGRFTDNACIVNINSSTDVNFFIGWVQGYYTGTYDGTTGRGYKNGAEDRPSKTYTPESFPVQPIWLGALNNAGTGERFSERQHSNFSCGNFQTAAEIVAMTAAIETYMDSLGTGVG